MLSNINSYFASNETAMKLRSARQEVIASNIANADTPGYKARDIDFAAAFSNATAAQRNASLDMRRTDSRHLTSKSHNALEAALMYRNDMQPSIDGNTVDMNTEMSNFTDNAMRYQASLTFMQQRITGMKSALQSQ
ncbi:flagellar basal body rod protein FlgB [Chitinimonas sp. BJB300]|uniref:flagellar basal body rod protein FlgB n=1 Tax=Chitinimonas sp. BJB300 TaxID=1559339 RepID=UPI000C0DA11A|nr:flagellar basal body rod protein FlgB [Chitinimonas sp. BJB300]PHV11233.1 flagellar basal body rod protein FlgB [Chitinimonas sp. BJB300]TSJ88622.1 flagellar basal body rod protein FlgB [Chitinimonas sp. BJB300]